MSEFIGRTGSHRSYSYPEAPRGGGNPLTAFARNFASGPKTGTDLGAGGVEIPWNSIDALSTPFTIAAAGVTVSIPGDVTAVFINGEKVRVAPTVPVSTPTVLRTIVTPPVFAAGFTTFNLSGNIDGSTTAGFIDDQTSVPITPRATGIVLVSGIVTVRNTTGAPIEIQIIVRVDGVNQPVPNTLLFTIAATNSKAVIPFMAELAPFSPLNETHFVEIFVTGNGGTLLADSSAIEVQEVSVATG